MLYSRRQDKQSFNYIAQAMQQAQQHSIVNKASELDIRLTYFMPNLLYSHLYTRITNITILNKEIKIFILNLVNYSI